MDPWSAQLGWVPCVNCFTILILIQPFSEVIIAIGAFYGETDLDEAYKALTLAADVGMTFWDTADVYGNSTFFHLL